MYLPQLPEVKNQQLRRAKGKAMPAVNGALMPAPETALTKCRGSTALKVSWPSCVKRILVDPISDTAIVATLLTLGPLSGKEPQLKTGAMLRR